MGRIVKNYEKFNFDQEENFISGQGITNLEAYSINDPADMDLKVWVERKPDKLFLTCLTCWENRKNQLNGERND